MPTSGSAGRRSESRRVGTRPGGGSAKGSKARARPQTPTRVGADKDNASNFSLPGTPLTGPACDGPLASVVRGEFKKPVYNSKFTKRPIVIPGALPGANVVLAQTTIPVEAQRAAQSVRPAEPFG